MLATRLLISRSSRSAPSSKALLSFYCRQSTQRTMMGPSWATQFHFRRDDDNQEKNSTKSLPPIRLIHLSTQRYFSTTTPSPSSDSSSPSPPPKSKLRQRAEAGATRIVVSPKRAQSATGAIQQYGPVFFGTYGTVYLLTLGTLFVGIDSHLIDPMTILHYVTSSGSDAAAATTTTTTTGGADGGGDATMVRMIVEFLEHHEITKWLAPHVEQNPQFANLAVAWIAAKFTEPIRFALVLAIVPKLARTLGYVPKEQEGRSEGTEAEEEGEKKDQAEGDGGAVNGQSVDSNTEASGNGSKKP